MDLHQRLVLIASCVALLMGGRGQEPAFRSLLDAQRSDMWDASVASNAKVELGVGALVITGPSGWILTRERHSDVVLRFDARADANSVGGVLVRALAEPNRLRSAYEVQIADGHGRAGMLLHHVKEDVRHPVPGNPPLADVTGDWQPYRIECRGDTVKAWVGGTQVLNARGLVQNVGRIGFEVVKGTIAIRNLAMQEHEWAEPEPPPGVVRSSAAGVTAPEALKMVRPGYTVRAMNAVAQGDVWIAAVVRPDGKVHDLRVYRSLAPDLDLAAIAALKQWRFRPARKDGSPVSVQATFSLSFGLR